MARALQRLVLVTLILIEVESTPQSAPDADYDFPLSKSLGYSVKDKFDTLRDSRLSQEYMDLYNEMLKASQESVEKFDEEEESKLVKIVGREKVELMKRGAFDRRRSAVRVRSPFGRRRVRSQATRREKLNSQSLRSHQFHIRHAGRAYSFEYNDN